MRTEPQRAAHALPQPAAQWAVFFERTGRAHQIRHTMFTLASARRYTPDFYVPSIGWVMVSEDSSLYTASTPARVTQSFADFYEFASGCEEWCYWLGGAIPFWSITEVQAMLALTLDDYEDPARLHQSAFMRQEWPDSYRWYKLRRHDGPRVLPPDPNECGPLLARLREAGFKSSILDMEAFYPFNDKAALVAARSMFDRGS